MTNEVIEQQKRYSPKISARDHYLLTQNDKAN